jgi:hypothetical protein
MKKIQHNTAFLQLKSCFKGIITLYIGLILGLFCFLLACPAAASKFRTSEKNAKVEGMGGPAQRAAYARTFAFFSEVLNF